MKRTVIRNGIRTEINYEAPVAKEVKEVVVVVREMTTEEAAEDGSDSGTIEKTIKLHEDMTVKELKRTLDSLEMEYDSKAKKADLVALLDKVVDSPEDGETGTDEL